jgi:biotin transporter BioY
MWPVPMTMQRFGVMALALALGARIAVGSVGLYLVQGAFGLPLFAGLAVSPICSDLPEAIFSDF